jgi:hypothetical protein
MNDVLAHAQACIATAMQMRPLFDCKPQTTEKLAAHALFLRCIDHFRAVVTLGQQGLDVEAMSLTRGISEALFVIGALLKGFCEWLSRNAVFWLRGRGFRHWWCLDRDAFHADA